MPLMTTYLTMRATCRVAALANVVLTATLQIHPDSLRM